MAKSDHDRQMIGAFLGGEESAVAVVDDWIRRAASPFRRRLSSHWDDLLQDLRLEVIRLFQSGRFRGESSLKSYLWRVVGHSCLDRIRSQRRWQWTDLADAPHAASPAAADPARSHASSATRDLLLRVLERMPLGCRRLWAMILAGLSYREMSEKVGISEGALRVRVLRCRRQALARREELLKEGNETPGSDATKGTGR